MKRDTQRSAVYAWERKALGARQWVQTFKTLDECSAYAWRVWVKERGRYGQAKVLAPHFAPGRGGGIAFNGRLGHDGRRGPGLIRLGVAARNEHVILHELAHILAPGDRHGPRFVGIVIGLYSRHLGLCAQTLLDRAVEAGIKVDVRSIGAVPEPTLAARLELHLPGTDMELAVALGVSWRAVRGAAMRLITKGRARWLRGKLVRIDPA